MSISGVISRTCLRSARLSLAVSSLGGLMTEYIFTTPTVDEGPAGSGRLFHFYKLPRGISIVLKVS